MIAATAAFSGCAAAPEDDGPTGQVSEAIGGPPSLPQDPPWIANQPPDTLAFSVHHDGIRVRRNEVEQNKLTGPQFIGSSYIEAASDNDRAVDAFYPGAGGTMQHLGTRDNGYSFWHDDWGKPANTTLFGRPGVTFQRGTDVVEVYTMARRDFVRTFGIFRRRYSIKQQFITDWELVADVSPAVTEAVTGPNRDPITLPEPTEGVAVTSWGAGRIDLFVLHLTTSPADRPLFHMWTGDSGAHWGQEYWPAPGAASWKGHVRAVTRGFDRLDIFYEGEDIRANGVTYASLETFRYERGALWREFPLWAQKCDYSHSSFFSGAAFANHYGSEWVQVKWNCYGQEYRMTRRNASYTEAYAPLPRPNWWPGYDTGSFVFVAR